MNTELLLKVKEQILKEPRQFLMELFFAKFNSCNDLNVPNCGTAACIAGWSIAIDKKLSPKQVWDLGLHEGNDAEKALGISTSQGDILFRTVNWPLEFRIRWWEAKTPTEKAQVAAERIDYFIATEGRE